MATIQEAIDKGFLKAKRIKTAHVDKIIVLPDDVRLFEGGTGNIYYINSAGQDSFPEEGKSFTWTSIVYEACTNKWATITEYRKEEPYKFLKLKSFPEGGVCWNPNKELQKYLEDHRDYFDKVQRSYKGIAWNSDSVWGVTAHSAQPPYDISQLEPFFNNPKEPDMVDRPSPPKSKKIGLDFMTRPTTDNFEIGKTYYIRDARQHSSFMITKCLYINDNDKDRIRGPYISNMSGGGDNFNFNAGDTPWINSGREVCLASDKDTLWLDVCIREGKFIELENVKRYLENSVPDHVKHYPLTPDDCFYPCPDKWCIVIDHNNKDALQDFMERRSYLWYHYSKDWKVGPGSDKKPNYFHFPPASQEPCHSHWKIQKGYTEITTEQFKQFYNSKSNSNVNEQEKSIGTSSIVKVCRPNLEIRPGSPIRATSFRCTKGKINLGG